MVSASKAHMIYVGVETPHKVYASTG